MIGKLLRYLTRQTVKVVVTDLERVRPVSSLFGFDRGTPIDRYYIDRFLENNMELIRGRVLEVGGSDYSRRFGGERVTSYEVLHFTSENKSATIVGDLTDTTTLPENTIDCFICTQTFNFIFDVQKAIYGAAHLLKPGGILLATVTGISQISRYDMERWGDYWRFTTLSMERLLEPVFGDNVEICSYGNVMASTAFLQGIVVEDLPDRSLLAQNDKDYQLLITVVARKGE